MFCFSNPQWVKLCVIKLEDVRLNWDEVVQQFEDSGLRRYPKSAADWVNLITFKSPLVQRNGEWDKALRKIEIR